MSGATSKPRFTVIEHAVWDSPETRSLSPNGWCLAIHMLRAALSASKAASVSEIDRRFDFGPSNVCLSPFQYRRAVLEVIGAGIVDRLPLEKTGGRVYFTWKLRPLKKLDGSRNLTGQETKGVTPKETERVKKLTPQITSPDPLRNLTPPNTDPNTNTRARSNGSKPHAKNNGKLSAEAQDRFDRFWTVYPKKQAKPRSLKAWHSLDPDENMLADILAALAWQIPKWAKSAPKYTPLPCNYLDDQRWTDEPEPDGSADFYAATDCVPTRAVTLEELAEIERGM